MAFKMKGSAFKLGNVATKSALKHSGAKFAAESKKESPNSKFDFAKAHNDNFAPGHTEHTGEQNEPQPGSKEYKRRKKAEKAKDDSGLEMKSPMKGKEGAVFSPHNRTHHLEEVGQDFRKKDKSPNEMKSPVKDNLDISKIKKTNDDGTDNLMYAHTVNAHKKHNRRHAAGEIDDNHKEIEKPKEEKSAKKDSGVKMKSPMKGEKKMIDGVEVHPDGHEGHHRVGKAANQKWGRGKSPAKHKKKVKKGGHGAGGIGRVAPVTAEQVKAHDDKYGEGHDNSHNPKKRTAADIGAGLTGGADFLINLAKTEAEKKKGTKTKK